MIVSDDNAQIREVIPVEIVAKILSQSVAEELDRDEVQAAEAPAELALDVAWLREGQAGAESGDKGFEIILY